MCVYVCVCVYTRTHTYMAIYIYMYICIYVLSLVFVVSLFFFHLLIVVFYKNMMDHTLLKFGIMPYYCFIIKAYSIPFDEWERVLGEFKSLAMAWKAVDLFAEWFCDEAVFAAIQVKKTIKFGNRANPWGQ